jgi:hypothetical protein
VVDNPSFASAESLEEAGEELAFTPVEPTYTAGLERQSLSLFVRDYKGRDVPTENRSLESHYGGFMLSQSVHSPAEAERLALEMPYGASPRPGDIAGHPARIYEMGPEPEPDDPDGRMPAVVVWHDDGMLYLVASSQLPTDELVRIAGSLY